MKLSKIAQFFTAIFLFYVLFLKYIIGNKAIILYGSVIVGSACMFIDMILAKKDMSLFPAGVLVDVFMCLFSFLTGLFVAVNMDGMVSAVKTYLAFSMVCMMICYISDEEKGIDWVAKILICVYIACSIWILAKKGYYYRGYGYILSESQNPNNLGLNMNLGLFCLAYRSKKNRRLAPIYFFLAVLFMYIIIGCGSRKCLIAGGLFFALWQGASFCETWKKSGMAKRISLIIIGVIVVFAVVYYMTEIYIQSPSFRRMQTLGDSDEGSSSDRMLYYRVALQYFLESPIIGNGLMQFGYKIGHPGSYSHSTYAEMIACWGSIGTLIYFIPHVSIGFRAIGGVIWQKNEARYFNAVIIALWIMELFLGIGTIWFYEIEHRLMWTLLFLLYDMYRIKMKNKGCVSKYVKSFDGKNGCW